jgi:hypothetical protein
MTKPRCIFCFDAEDPEDIQPLYAGSASGQQPVAWVHVHCLADYADNDTMREFDEIDAELKTSESGS